MIQLSRDELLLWTDNPTTVKILSMLKVKRQDYTEILASGTLLFTDSAERTAISTAKIVGIIAGIDHIFNLDIEIQEDDSR